MCLLSPLLAALVAGVPPAQVPTFAVSPYVQLGDRPKLSSREGVTILWQADPGGSWRVQARQGVEWREVEQVTSRPSIPASLRQFQAEINDLQPGGRFEYRVLRDGVSVFGASAVARKSAGQPFRAAIFGDIGAGTPAQRRITYQVWKQEPDFGFITGDIVYDRGRMSEYRARYFPILNSGEASPSTGAPLLRSTLFAACIGNHDAFAPDLGRYPDGLAFYINWALPLNGPLDTIGERGTPRAKLTAEFKAAAAGRYPALGNYSFDYGNTHWTVLDGNAYVDWSNPKLRTWLDRDLAAAKSARWRIVAFHEPGFHSSKKHAGDVWMKSVHPILERRGVDVAFSGHVHNYQRSHPIRMQGERMIIDRTFNGKSATRPKGVIYIVTGAAGATLYDRSQNTAPGSWKPFTARFVSGVHSFTMMESRGDRILLRQIDDQGKEVDRIAIDRQ
jgi:acid phosphatase type 7